MDEMSCRYTTSILTYSIGLVLYKKWYTIDQCSQDFEILATNCDQSYQPFVLLNLAQTAPVFKLQEMENKPSFLKSL